MSFLSSVFSAAVPGLVQGAFSLFGKKGLSERKQAALQHKYWRESVDYQTQNQGRQLKELVKGAQEAGFNPLTVLRGGGGAGYQQTHAPILSAPFTAGGSSGFAAGLASGIQAAFDYDPLDEEKSRIELEIMEAQLRRISNSSPEEYTRLGAVPVATGSRNKSSEVAKQGQIQQGDVEVTNVWPKSFGLEAHPYFVNAEAWEDRYGEIIGGAADGILNTSADVTWNVNRGLAAGIRYFGGSSDGNWMPYVGM